MKTITAFLLSSAIIGMCRGFPSGAPSSTCGSMLPRHGSRNSPQDHSRNPSPYTITIEEGYDTYTPGQNFKLSLHSTDSSVTVKGFILEARTISGNPHGPVGTFIEPGRGTKLLCDDKAVTHYRTWRVRGDKFHATWVAPDTDVGEIVFVTTVVKEYAVYWSNVRSVVVRPFRPPTTTPAPRDDRPTASGIIICNETVLTPLPEQRPHVAILCNEHSQCPCGWFCCTSCMEKMCVGHAICRQPLADTREEEDDKSSGEEPAAQVVVDRIASSTATPKPKPFPYAYNKW